MNNVRLRDKKSWKLLGVTGILMLAIVIGSFSSIYSLSFFIIAMGLIGISVVSFFLVINTEKTSVGLSLILIISLFLFPSIPIGGLRVDDGIAIFLTVTVAFLFYKQSNYVHSPINKWIFLYLVYMLSITILHMILNDLSLFYMFFAIKEVQYFIYFFGVLFVMKNDWFRQNFTKLFLWLTLITMVWGMYQIVFDASAGWYGIGIISEPSASQSGGVFFIIFTFTLYLINSENRTKQRTFYYFLFLCSWGLLFATQSRTAILASALMYGIYLCFTLFRISTKRLLISGYILVLTLPLLYLVLKGELEGILHRMNHIDSGASIRSAKWDYLLSFGSDLGLIFGEGRGFVQTITGGLTLAADSQYVRNILELGYIGSALFLFVILSIIIFAFKNMKKHYGESLYLIMITGGFLIMSVTHEVFLVTIQASFFWVVAGALVGKIINDNRVEVKPELIVEE